MEAKNYIVEIGKVKGDDTTIFLWSEGEPVEYLFAIVAIAERGACIVDNCYRSISEAQLAWPDAIPPKPHHLTRGYTIEGAQ